MNRAAWYVKEGARLEVREAKKWKPDPNEILIKVHAAAINPVDWKIQSGARASYVKNFPLILGEDVSGEVVDANDNSNFKVGDRVIGNTEWLSSQEPRHGGFQLYAAIAATQVAKIPKLFDFTSASVIPLALSTSATGLYAKNMLDLPLPKLQVSTGDDSILIWGASTTVASIGIQLAKLSGLTVFTTASAKNLDYAKSLGADRVFDYRDAQVVPKLVQAIKEDGKTFLGALDTVAESSTLHACADVILQTQGRKVIAAVQTPPDDLPKEIQANRIFATTLHKGGKDERVGEHVWGKWLEQVLESGQLKAHPPAKVVGTSLDDVQGALDLLKGGSVSATKLVIDLSS